MAANSSKVSVLLVDDEPMVTDALCRHFTRRGGLSISKACNAEQAFEILEGTAVDVVVSDERMPGLSGSEFLGVVRRRFPDTIRMILSGQSSLEAAVRAINEGEVYRFFLKPCDPTDLIITIEQAVAHKRLEARSRELLREFRKQAQMLESIEPLDTDLLKLDVDDTGAIVVSESADDPDVNDLLKEIEAAMARTPRGSARIR